jgi:predicted N-formylglutamate amidohydrolase
MPATETSIPEISELTPIPGNIGLSEGGKAARLREIFRPLIAMHSYAPIFMGVARPHADFRLYFGSRSA